MDDQGQRGEATSHGAVALSHRGIFETLAWTRRDSLVCAGALSYEDAGDRLGKPPQHVAVAYAKLTGVVVLDRAGLPQRSRFVIGTGFGLTEPEAVEALAEKGAEVRIVIGSHRSGMGSAHSTQSCIWSDATMN
jgi:hypothetical protein